MDEVVGTPRRKSDAIIEKKRIGIRCCYWHVGDNMRLNNAAKKSHTFVPPMTLRRLTSLGKNAVKMLEECAVSENIPWVVSCRYGDSERMMSLFTSLVRQEVLSPTDFSMSVHNAIIGMYSIATQNRAPHSALSGGGLSFEAGLIEAYALQKERGGTIGYIYYDRPLPHLYEGKVKDDSPEIFFVLLLTDSTQEKESVDIANEFLYLKYLQDDDYVLEKKSSDFVIVMDFVKSDAKECKISVPGGHLHFERVLREK